MLYFAMAFSCQSRFGLGCARGSGQWPNDRKNQRRFSDRPAGRNAPSAKQPRID
jgi:hypothetical protein